LKTCKARNAFTHIIFFDTECWIYPIYGDVELHEFRMACGEYVRRDRKQEIERFYTKDPFEFWKWVDSKAKKKSTLYVIAHNADYDVRLSKGFSSLLKLGYKLNGTPIIESQRYIVKFKNEEKNKSIVIIDSFNWFKTSVEKMGEMIGYPKVKPTEDFSKWNEVPEWKMKEYCFGDVEILRRFVLNFIDWWTSEDMGAFGFTIASCAFNAYRHRFMKEKIEVGGKNEIVKFERQAYRGGRCEVFYIGYVDDIYYLDVNSMYPFVMKEFEYPVRRYGEIIYNPDLKWFFDIMKQYLVIAKVLIQITKPVIGVKRFLDPSWSGYRLIFPVGRFWATLTSPEIELAMKYGKVLKVEKLQRYEKGKPFVEFIDYFYNKRLEAKAKGQDIYQYFYKTVMNSLYGKFGQRKQKFEEVGETDQWGVERHPMIVNGELRRLTIYKFGGKQYIQAPDYEEGYNTNVPIAAYVTAYARCYLTELIAKAGWENVHYCDTDSLVVNYEGYQNLKDLVSSRELGKLKLEETGWMEIKGAKNYVLNGKEKLKGIKKDAEMIKVNREYIEYEQRQWLRFRSLLRSGDPERALIIKTRKKVQKEYKKALVDGNRVKPYILWEI